MRRILFATIVIALAGPVSGQNALERGDVNELYQEYCSNCHGENLTGGTGSSLVDDTWAHGSSDAEIAKVISEGIPDTEMVAWQTVFSAEQIRSLVIFIREQRGLLAKQARAEQLAPEDGKFTAGGYSFKLEKVAQGDGILWAMEFLPDGSILATQRDGKLWQFKDGERSEITGIPAVHAKGQGGLLEIQKHPDYDENGWIYLGFSEPSQASSTSMTAIARGKVEDGQWKEHEAIFSLPVDLHLPTSHHYGTRFVFQDGYLFFSIGDRGRMDMAQDLTRPNGKIHRIHDDGRIPEDNPFVDVEGAVPSIWSYGHRNPQGLDQHPVTGELWEAEHGPRGGDEINLIKPAVNHGWPVITYGMNYNGTPMTDKTAQEGMEQPRHYWVPSIGVAGIDFYEGNVFPEWTHDLFVTGMSAQELHRIVIEDGEVVADEVVLQGQGRVRDVHSGPDGYLYICLMTSDRRIGGIYRLVPAD